MTSVSLVSEGHRIYTILIEYTLNLCTISEFLSSFILFNIFRLAQLNMLIFLILVLFKILCLGDIIWENCSEIFGNFRTRGPVEHDGKLDKSIDHEH